MDYRIVVSKKRKYWYSKIVSIRNGQTIYTSETYSSEAKAMKTARRFSRKTGIGLVVC